MKITPPNITPGDWQTAHDFPGCVISGQVEQSHRGKSAMVVCKVQGSCLPTYKANLVAISATPDTLAALASFPDFPDDFHPYAPDGVIAFAQAVNLWRQQARAALIKAGYNIEE